MRILYWGDSPLVGTGIGTVAGFILGALVAAGHQVDIVGLSSLGALPPVGYPMRVQHVAIDWGDPYGYRPLAATLARGEHDLLLAYMDAEPMRPLRDVLRSLKRRPRVVAYVPTDWEISAAAGELLEELDQVVVPTEFGRSNVEAAADTHPIAVIPHGVDVAVFRRRPATLRARLQVADDRPLLVCVAQNSVRKNLAVLLAGFAQWRHRHPDAALYLHSAPRGDSGGDLHVACASLELAVGRDVYFPEHAPPHGGAAPTDVAAILSAADALVMSSLSEGWCLPVTEAFAVQCPVVAPDHTAFAEIASGRAVLYPAGGRQWLPALGQFRAHVDPADVADGIEQLWRMPADERAAMVERAHTFALEHDWQRITPRWVELVEEVHAR